jgi:DNA polymerase zeta
MPYVVVAGPAKSRLMDLVYHPSEFMKHKSLRLNSHYYITKQIIPTLSRMLSLLGVNVASWFNEMPKYLREFRPPKIENKSVQRTRIDQYYLSQKCPICDSLAKAGELCDSCKNDKQTSSLILLMRQKLITRALQRLNTICMSCMGDYHHNKDIECDSLDCSVMYERVKVQQHKLLLDSYGIECGI